MQPNEKRLKTLEAIADFETGKDAVINRADLDECEVNGWVEAVPDGGRRPTDEGRRVLRENR